jgi:hypothetical protein
MTAVEFLLKQIFSEEDKSFLEFYNGEIQRANKLFEQQIIDAHVHGHNAPSSTLKNFDAKQYYLETYKKNNI